MTTQAERLAADPLRPQYHCLPPANWMNDPNGLIQWQGQYHLFYQYNPDGAFWGNIHWGHAVSDNLAHWRDLPVALAPTPYSYDQDGCWTGCAVDDGGVPTFVYTGWRRPQEFVCLATSRDNLVTWAKSAHNPVIAAPPPGLNPPGFRDPYVWRECDAWRMVIGSGFAGQGGTVLLYQSPNLRDWRYLGPLLIGHEAEHGTMWECPNIFPLGDKHVLIVSIWRGTHAVYFVGAYDGQTFTPERQGIVDSGGHFFAPQVMADDRQRRLMFGWIWEGRSEEAQRAAGWAGVQSLPRVLSLTPDNTLAATPAPELTVLRGEHTHCGNRQLTPDADDVLPVEGNCMEILAEFEVDAATCGLKLCCAPDDSEETLVGYDGVTQCLFIDRERASLSLEAKRGVQQCQLQLAEGETLKLRIFLDRSVIEVFANDRSSLTSRIYPTRLNSLGVKLFARGSIARLESLDFWQMQSAWPGRS